MTHRRFWLRVGFAGVAGVLATGLALATYFDLSHLPKSSIKVERITPDMMFNICGFEKSDKPFFLDSEYRRAIAEYDAQLRTLEPGSQAAERIAGLREGLEECRENDRNRRNVARAKRSCRALVKNHKEAEERAADYIGNSSDGALRNEVLSWGERFREPLEKCLKSMPCRLDNRQDMEEALAVYHEVVDQMTGWFQDVKGAESMKICGVTIRDLKKWCQFDSPVDSDGNRQIKDVCVDAKSMRDAINLVKSLKQMPPGGWPPPNAQGAVKAGSP